MRTFGPAVVALLGFCGSTLWLSHLARDRGNAVEAQLYASWDGIPFMAMLRHRDARLPGPLKARYKRFLQKQLPYPPFPSEEDELRDRAAADAIYASAGAWLLSHTRDRTRFALLFEENVHYGFRRNFWALKPIALAAAVCSLLISLGAIVAGYTRTGAEPAIEAEVATGLLVCYTLFIVIRVNRDWVQLAAEAYARQLLAACVREGAWPADSLSSRRPR
jgi:hypothetical protein